MIGYVEHVEHVEYLGSSIESLCTLYSIEFVGTSLCPIVHARVTEHDESGSRFIHSEGLRFVHTRDMDRAAHGVVRSRYTAMG